MPSINGAILIWARETLALTLEDAAKKLNFKDGRNVSAAEKLAAFEDGTKEPSRGLLSRMSVVYRRPILTFYLDRPPAVGDRGEDFRSLPDREVLRDNAYVDVIIRDIKSRQSVVRETLLGEEEGRRLDFVGRCTIQNGKAKVVRTIRNVLAVDVADCRRQRDPTAMFRLLRRKAEEAGIYVLLKGNLGSHHSTVSVSSFRGFVLSDDIAPFIVINDNDAVTARSFTLIHEVAHLVLGRTGVSGDSTEMPIERFCNDVASEFFLPASEFADFRVSDTDVATLKTEVSKYAAKLHLSGSHIAYRLYRRNDIGKRLWLELKESYRNEWYTQRRLQKKQRRESDKGPNPNVVQRFKLGALVDLVQRLHNSRVLTTSKAGMLLDRKPLKVHKLFHA